MSFFKSITDFFQSIFMASSPEVKQKQALRKLESELRSTDPQIYKDGAVLPAFADALRIMFENTKPILDILSDTVCTTDLERNHRFTEQLLLTGFPEEMQEILLSLTYEKRKDRAREAESMSRFLESEHRQLEKAIKYLSTPEFSKIDAVLDNIKQLYDVCKFPYLTVLRVFDHDYVSGSSPNFQPAPMELLESQLEELYYVTIGLSITKSSSNAICALQQLRVGSPVSEEQANRIVGNLRKIQSIVHQVFTAQNLKNLIQVSKKDSSYEPKKAIYKEESRRKYAEYLETRFQVDGTRLKSELQDETISNELHQLFSNTTMIPVVGYNFEMNNQLIQSTPTSFNYIMPMQILKSFIENYYTPHVKPLLNDIVIEGYFSNPAYKSEFSSYVYALNEASERIAYFEKKFQRGEEFDESVIASLIKDSHRDSIFVGRLKELIEKINKTAKDLIQNEVGSVFHVYKICSDILVETKKAHSDAIENLKVLMLSSRNQQNTETLEKQHPLWSVFLEIMRNYVIITTVEKK